MPKDFAKRHPSSKTANTRSFSKDKPQKRPTKRKNNNRKASASKRKIPLWVWLVTAVGVMGFALFLSQLTNQSSSNATASEPAEQAVIQTVPETASKVKFDFYEILKGHEVEVDDRVIEKTPEKSNIIYWLQVASFRQVDDAEQMRVKLLLLNLDTAIEATTNKDQQMWHRVMVGPFTSRSRLAKARSILASNEMTSLLIKR